MRWLSEGVRQIGAEPVPLADWQAVASEVTAGRIRLLGKTWPTTALPDWHLDPDTGRHWPAAAYCFDIPYRHAKSIGDVKYVWELSRLQYLQPIAALAAQTDDSALAALCARHIESWIDANPPFRGIHWASMIELAHRVVSLLVVAGLVGERAFDDKLRAKVGASLAAHGWWIERFPSRFSSANNHCIAEAAGLYLLGVLAPGLAQAVHWEAVGRRRLEREAGLQFHADGVPAEQSVTYGAFSLEWLALCGKVGAVMGRPFDEAYWHRLIGAGRFLRAITDANGHQPHIGDDDGSHVLASGFEERGYVNSILGALAAVTDTPDFAPPYPVPHLREAVFGRPAPPPQPSSGVRHYPAGGYTLAREFRGIGEVLWLMDHGPLGYLSIAAHGHADALGVWLHIGGRAVLVDAGTYGYYGDQAWRDHFRSTPAHNTMVIAGMDSSRMAGPFNWAARATTVVTEMRTESESWIVEAEHDGYRPGFGLLHRRRLERKRSGRFVLTDWLVGPGRPVPVEIGFLFDPALTLIEQGNVWSVMDGDRLLLRIQHRGDLTGSIEQGEAAPRRGWYAPAFGSKQPTRRLCFAGLLTPGATAETIFELPDA